MNSFCPKCFESQEIKDFIKLNAENLVTTTNQNEDKIKIEK